MIVIGFRFGNTTGLIAEKKNGKVEIICTKSQNQRCYKNFQFAIDDSRWKVYTGDDVDGIELCNLFVHLTARKALINKHHLVAQPYHWIFPLQRGGTSDYGVIIRDEIQGKLKIRCLKGKAPENIVELSRWSGDITEPWRKIAIKNPDALSGFGLHKDEHECEFCKT